MFSLIGEVGLAQMHSASYSRACCPAEINVRGMHDWKSLGTLAEFPGTLVLEDLRPANEAYPSELLTPESLQVLEPELSQQAAAKGARLYEQEGA